MCLNAIQNIPISCDYFSLRWKEIFVLNQDQKVKNVKMFTVKEE